MLERKGVEYRTVDLLPGFHPLVLRLAGFRGGSVPALKIDGRRLQGSLTISRALEHLVPDPPLLPTEPQMRQAVVEAETWAERELQPIARRLNRFLLRGSLDMREVFVARVGMPAPALMAIGMWPLAVAFARMSGADDATVRADIERLPSLVDHVDSLIASGVIGGAEPNAADFQVGTSVWALMGFSDLRRFVDGRPAAALAERMIRPVDDPVPPGLPAGWLVPAPG